MSAVDRMRTIETAEPVGPTEVRLTWSDGTQADVDLSGLLGKTPFEALQDPVEFARVEVGDWGHSLTWPSGVEASAERLWLETLAARGRHDTRAFLEWRLSNGLSLSRAAEVLGLSRRMIAYYSNGEKPVPRTVLLACYGWESEMRHPGFRKGSYLRDAIAFPIESVQHASKSMRVSYVTYWPRKRDEMKKHELFVERRPQGDYAVRRGNAERASAVKPTQAEAIERAREIDPKAAVHVERVRNTTQGQPDKWRKA